MINKIKIRLKSLLGNKTFFLSAFFIVLISYSILPLLNSYIYEYNVVNLYNNINPNYLFGEYKTDSNKILSTIDRDNYVIIQQDYYVIDNISYAIYISSSNIKDFYLPILNSLYVNIDNEVEDKFFYSNSYNANLITINDKTYVNSNIKLDLDLRHLIEDNYILNIILIIDDNYNAYKETDVVIVNDKINDIEKERLTDINYIYGNTLTSSQDGMKNMAILLSFLMLLPLIFITIISLFIINILFNKTINEDKIKKKFYLKTKYLTEDYIIDYLLVYLIPMLIGLFISYLLVYLLNYQLFISIYIISIIFSLFVLLVFIKIRKKKLRMC